VKTLFGADWYSDADLGNLRDKDSAMKLRGIWVQEFAEMESLTRAETGSLKAFCSRATDRQRDPYGRVPEDSPRRCVFIATVNEGGYLKDSTGARRFWPLAVNAPINVARLKADRDQLWAEAATLEAQGASDVLPRKLWAMAGERQAEQTSGDPWSDTLRDFLEARARDGDVPDADDVPALPPDRVHTSELFDALKISTADQTKDKAQRLRTTMEASLGWHHRRGVRVLGRASAGYTREKLKAWLA
jgi:predicted P-loop ATPase